jgi:hypothetical protein
MVGTTDQIEAAADANEELTAELRNAVMASLLTTMRARKLAFPFDAQEVPTDAATEDDLFAMVAALAHCAGKIMLQSRDPQSIREMHAALIDEWTTA